MPVDAVEEQVRAYNSHDVEAFARCYAADVIVEDGEGVVLLSGRDALRDHYANLFAAAPDLRAEVVARIRVGSFVIDEEHVTGAPRGAIHAAVVYRVDAAGLIDRVRFLT